MSRIELKGIFLGATLAGLSSWAFALPVASAGADRFAYAGSFILLDGGGYSPDGKTITDVLWNVESAPSDASYSLLTPNYPFSPFISYTTGVYDLSYRVFDGAEWSATDLMTVRVATNLPPVIVMSITPTFGYLPLKVTFDGSASYDPEGGSLIYYWNFGDGGDGSDESAGVYEYTHYSGLGLHSVFFEVMDEMAARAVGFAFVDIRRPGNNNVPEPNCLALVIPMLTLMGLARRKYC